MKINLAQQIAEIDRELAMRRDLYTVQVSRGKMRQSVADYHLAHMKAARASLVWLQENELLIKQRLSNANDPGEVTT